MLSFFVASIIKLKKATLCKEVKEQKAAHQGFQYSVITFVGNGVNTESSVYISVSGPEFPANISRHIQISPSPTREGPVVMPMNMWHSKNVLMRSAKDLKRIVRNDTAEPSSATMAEQACKVRPIEQEENAS